jgi:hypothetical protein
MGLVGDRLVGQALPRIGFGTFALGIDVVGFEADRLGEIGDSAVRCATRLRAEFY